MFTPATALTPPLSWAEQLAAAQCDHYNYLLSSSSYPVMAVPSGTGLYFTISDTQTHLVTMFAILSTLNFLMPYIKEDWCFPNRWKISLFRVKYKRNYFVFIFTVLIYFSALSGLKKVLFHRYFEKLLLWEIGLICSFLVHNIFCVKTVRKLLYLFSFET